MNIELTKEQSQKGDDFLKKLLSDGALERKTVYDFFNNKDLAIVVCKTLKKIGVIDFDKGTYSDPFTIVFPEDGISTFLGNGGLTKIADDRDEIKEKDDNIKDLTAKNLRLQNRQLKRNVLYSILGFIGGYIISNLKDVLQFLKLLPLE